MIHSSIGWAASLGSTIECSALHCSALQPKYRATVWLCRRRRVTFWKLGALKKPVSANSFSERASICSDNLQTQYIFNNPLRLQDIVKKLMNF